MRNGAISNTDCTKREFLSLIPPEGCIVLLLSILIDVEFYL